MNNLTWHCALVLNNDPDCDCAVQCLVTHVMSRIYHNYKGEAYTDQRKARAYVLAQFLRCYVEEITDAENQYSWRNQMMNELICGALQEVNFREIAETLIGDYSPKSPAEVAESEEYFAIRGFGDYDIDED